VRVVPLSDFSEASELFSSWHGKFEQISRGRFAGTLQALRGGRVRIIGITSNQRVRLRGRDVSGLVSVYPVTDGNGGSLWHGRQLAPGQLVVHGAEAETDHYSARRTDNLGLSMPPADLEEAARALLGTDRATLPRTWSALSPPPGAFAGLHRKLSTLLGRGVADPSLLGTPEGGQLEQECVRALVAALFTVDPMPELSLPARSEQLHRAEDLMRTQLGGGLGAIDLCRELGVSDRTLRLAFRERYGLGPIAYYKCLRLNAVRTFMRANPLAPIADVARVYGFHHLGNFAADYRRLFGERPSETVRG
jgi:AraC family ethanolamine operon transcriptional activator